MALSKSKKGRLSIEEIKDQLVKTKIIEHSIVNELETSFMEYAMSTIVARALPDARDGLKPVHRRVLYAAYGLNMTNDKPHKKSARLVGEVIGKYHPHGDTAAYLTMVRMAQDFSMRYPLIDGHGNFGSIDGDSPAAMRYTEARLSKISNELLRNIEKNTVPFVENYDGSEIEPTVFPTILPNLLLNGSSGIAVGMATNMPPHALTEVCNAIKAVIANPEIEIEGLMEHIKGPDFPTGAEIVGENGIYDYFRTGRGSITVRSKYTIEDIGNNKHAIIFNEIPYIVNKLNLINKIVDLVKAGSIDGISDLRDESSRDGIRIVIETKRDVIPTVLLNKLYKSTSLQTNFSVNNLALVDGVPRILNIKELMEVYLKHQYDVLERKFNFELKKAEERAHILLGLLIAVNNIDAVIKIVRSADNNENAQKELILKYDLSEIQSKAILDMRLRSLSGLERGKVEKEHEELNLTIVDIKDILANKPRQSDIICENLDYLITKYGDERQTNILYGVSSSIDDEDLIPVEDIVVIMSRRGYLKRLPIDTYKTQHRGGVGVIGSKVNEDDDIDKILTTSTHIDLLIFTDLGKVYRVRGHEIPIGSRQSKGIPAINIIDIEKNERILSILPIDNYEDGSLFFITKNGLGKRTKLTEFSKIRRTGKIAISLKEEDKLFDVRKTMGDEEIFIGASNGKLVRFAEENVRKMGRKTSGVRVIKLDELAKEHVVGFNTSSEGQYILSVGSKGLGKLTDVDSYRLTKRGAKGVVTLKVTTKTGKLASTKIVKGDEELLLITTTGKVIRLPIDQISITKSRSTSGVILMNLESGEKIQSVAIFKSEKDIDQMVEEFEKTKQLEIGDDE